MRSWAASLLHRLGYRAHASREEAVRAQRLAMFETEAEILDQHALLEVAMTEPDPVLAGKAAAELQRQIFAGVHSA